MNFPNQATCNLEQTCFISRFTLTPHWTWTCGLPWPIIETLLLDDHLPQLRCQLVRSGHDSLHLPLHHLQLLQKLHMGSGRSIGTYDVGGGSVGKSERGKAEHVACAFNLAQSIRLKKRGNTKKFDIWKFQDLFTIVVQSDCTREVVLKRSFIVYTLEKHCDQFFIRTHFCKNYL